MNAWLASTLFLLINGVLPKDLPEPRIVILGQTGTGKSTLANVLIGEEPSCKSCTFPICDGIESCTKETKYAIGMWLGQGAQFTVVDTPGFGDSDQDDNGLIDEMMDVLKNSVKKANTLMLLINAEQQRFNNALQQMLREMQALFGDMFWNNAVIGVSHWAFDANSIAKRNYTGMTEEKFLKQWNDQIKAKFHLNVTLPGMFIDSFSQQPWNKPDKHQQDVFKKQTDKLWTFAKNKGLFAFKTVEDVLVENDKLKKEVDWLNDVITKNITEIQNKMKVTQNDVVTNKNSITANKKQLDMASDEWKSDNVLLNQKLQTNMNSVTALTTRVDLLTELPLGTIIPWAMKPSTGTNPTLAAQLPKGWVRCDGSKIPAPSKWAGQLTPDLNGQGLFLRGGKDNVNLQIEQDQLQDHLHNDPGHTHLDAGHSHTDAGHSHTDAGHTHAYSDVYAEWPKSGGDPHDGDSDGAFVAFKVSHAATSAASKANIQANHANIQANKAVIQKSASGIGGVTSAYRKGGETRPKNMKVVYVMRVF